MAGHNKWSKIKRRKEVLDSKRGKIFTKVIREIILATQESGTNPEENLRLRIAIQQAKNVNLPKSNISRAIEKGSKVEKEVGYKKILYEAYAPHGIALLIETITDNLNRTVAMIRAVLNKYGGKLEKKGGLQHLFDYRGIVAITKPEPELWEKTILQLLDVGVLDIEEEEATACVITSREHFQEIQRALERLQVEIIEANLQYLPKSTLLLEDKKEATLLRIINELESLDDVDTLYHNLVTEH